MGISKERNLWFLFPLALDLSLSSCQLFKVKKTISEWKHYHILVKEKGVIWWLFHDDLRVREQEEKVTTNSAPNIKSDYCLSLAQDSQSELGDSVDLIERIDPFLAEFKYIYTF